MIRVLNSKVVFGSDGKALELQEIVGLSTDTKPTDGLVTGSSFLEVDTGKLSLYDEVNEEWNEV